MISAHTHITEMFQCYSITKEFHHVRHRSRCTATIMHKRTCCHKTQLLPVYRKASVLIPTVSIDNPDTITVTLVSK